MKAAIHERYGAWSRVVEIRDLEKPEPAPDFERVADALEHMGGGHPRGKIVVTLPDA